jgi:hypothetical protein
VKCNCRDDYQCIRCDTLIGIRDDLIAISMRIQDRQIYERDFEDQIALSLMYDLYAH